MKLYTLKNSGYTAIINATNGANCISLRHKNFPRGILREPNYEKGIDNPYLYGSPILFPVNRIENGAFYFNGRIYTFPINEKNTNCHLHGNLHQKEFTVIEQTENSITCYYEEKARVGFLHDYAITINYTLSDQGLLQIVTVKNLSDSEMPCMLGFHTTFSVKENCLIKTQIDKEIERNMNNYLPTERVLPLDSDGKNLLNGTFTPKTLSKHYLAGGDTAEIFFPDEKVKVVYEYDKKYLYRLIYASQDFICLEPQTCVVNAPNLIGQLKNSGLISIKPYSELNFYTKIRLKEDK